MLLVRTFLVAAVLTDVRAADLARFAERTGLRRNDDAPAIQPVQGSVGNDPVTSVSTGSDHTVLRADVLREYGHYAQGEPFDIVYFPDEGFVEHLQADDLDPTHSQEEARTMAFNLTGHLVQEFPNTKHHIACPACPNSVCPGENCHFNITSEHQELAENEEGTEVLAPRRELQHGVAGVGHDKGCFSLESTVVVKGKGATPIKNLRLGDMILSDERGTYTKFYSRGHYHEKALSQFLRIFTEVAEKPLEATPDHLVFMAARALPVPASTIKVGEFLLTVAGPARVTAVKKISRRGLSNPTTLSGTIVVDGVVASTQTVVPGFAGAEPGWVYLGGVKVVHWDWLVHAAHAPHRLVCGRLATCAEPLDDEGMAPFPRFLLGLAQRAVKNQSVLYSVFVLLAVVLAMAPFYAIELLFENVFIVLVGGCVAAGMWRILSDVKVKVKSV